MSDRTLSVTSAADLQNKVSDVEIIGDGDAWKLLSKASSKNQGWMKSAKGYHIAGVGCIVQVTTQQGSSVAEALALVPGTTIVDDVNGGRKIVKA